MTTYTLFVVMTDADWQIESVESMGAPKVRRPRLDMFRNDIMAEQDNELWEKNYNLDDNNPAELLGIAVEMHVYAIDEMDAYMKAATCLDEIKRNQLQEGGT